MLISLGLYVPNGTKMAKKYQAKALKATSATSSMNAVGIPALAIVFNPLIVLTM